MSRLILCQGLVLAFALLGQLPTSAAQSSPPAFEFRTVELGRGVSIEVGVVEPEGYQPEKSYPVLLAFPPGPQTRKMVEAGMARYWGAEAKRRGFVVLSPVAPKGKLFFAGGRDLVRPFLNWIRMSYQVKGNAIHLAGASNGGRSAFQAALDHPFEWASLLVAPGVPPRAADLSKIKHIPVRAYCGETDKRWLDAGLAAINELKQAGASATMTVLKGEGHVPESLDAKTVMQVLAGIADQRTYPQNAKGAVALALDDFHDAAAKADGPRYFGRFHQDGVFLGTDGTERWTKAEFESWAAKYFKRKSAWIFVPRDRQIFLSENEDVAWFDETAASAHYGPCRGTGTLLRVGNDWKVAQYNLTIPVPNDLASDLVNRIRRNDQGTLAEAKTIFIARHAEKIHDPSNRNPKLSDAGAARAKNLKNILAAADLESIWSSDYHRTMDTAKPTAEALGLEIKKYNPRDMKALSRQLRKPGMGRRMLVVGHSNTVPALMSALGVANAPKLSEKDYGDLFVVRLSPLGEATVLRLKY